MRVGQTSEERDRIKALERENRELRQANEILRKASAYFAQAELDRPFKKCSSQKFYVCSMKTAGSMAHAKCGDNFAVKVSMWRVAP